ncbi:MAG: transketolase [Alphaproteobacteria bacterium]|nr:transketolase [Alphaproteobacteria bacterium]
MTVTDVKAATAAVTQTEMANAIRFLAIDAIEAAKSGHPGMPMGMADVATVLFTRYLKYDPARPDWPDRDRFVLSAGHGSMLLYALLYLTGYPDIDLEQIKNFRQLGSLTAGHPERGHAAGIETTTGPLGQGFANAVGMAIAERILADRFGADLVDHHTYVIAGDGCLMEGISHEAASLAGHLRLGKLIVLYDDNEISIDGPTGLTLDDDPLGRFRSYGWEADRVDGHDGEAVAAAILAARSSERPSLIACRTTIGYGAPTKAGTAATHGAPLGSDEAAGTRAALGWSHAPFEVPDAIVTAWREAGARGSDLSAAWRDRLSARDVDLRAEFERVTAGEPAAALAEAIVEFKREAAAAGESLATRQASGRVLERINTAMPETIGGSADLTGSNNTRTAQHRAISSDDFGGRYLYYGVREHAMAATMNGIALHGGLVPYAGTFLVFSDYCRPAIRLSALMGQRVVYVMTHDSIGLGEDGPTHQPVEQLASLRAIPNLNVFRPADAVEVAECWALALATLDRPSVIALTRQAVPALRTTHRDENLSARGAYEILAAEGEARVTLLATGSEVGLAAEAATLLATDGIPARVVSMPCWELFEAQDESYRETVLGPKSVRVAVEAATIQGWERYLCGQGGFVGMGSFGASAPAKALFEHFQITPQAVAALAKSKL